jgi:Xaa-Pro aminopeptidase
MAIEPGVYLKSIGGVRIENDYAVTKGKAKRLTTGIDDILFV